MSHSDFRPSAIHVALGPDFDGLPGPVRDAHDHAGVATYAGTADVTCGGAVARLLCRAIGLPRAGTGQPVTVGLETRADGVDSWQRDFAGRKYRSTLRAGPGGRLIEHQGPLTNIFRLSVAGDRLCLDLVAFRLLGLPLPAWLHPSCRAYETAQDGRFVFDIVVGLPWLGHVIHYRGIMTRQDPAGE